MPEQDYLFTIEGEITPYVRMTQRGKFTSPRAHEYLASQDAIRFQIKEQMNNRNLPMLPRSKPLGASIVFWTARGHTFDLDNAVKAVVDAAQGIVFKNDLWFDWLHAERRASKDERCQLWITPV